MTELAESASYVRYERAPMTDRRGDTLALKYGYKDLSAFTDDLPVGARVVDIGAGFSSLGRQACYRRSDIEWVNVDIQYEDWTSPYAHLYEQLIDGKPSNLHFEPADAMSLVQDFGENQFDRTYSYWMLPHIILASRELGLSAVENMIRITKSSGNLAVGPISRPLFTSDAIHKRALHITPASDDSSIPDQAERLVSATTPSPVEAMIQRFMHKYVGPRRQ